MTRRARIAVAAMVAIGLLGLALYLTLASRAWRTIERAAGEAGWTALRVVPAEPDARFRVEDGEGPALLVRRYGVEPPIHGGILLVHGNRAQGGGHPVYRVLARALARDGWVVWSMDLRGYGGSEPVPDGPLRADDLLVDVRRVMRRMAAAYPEVPLGVVGHSIGAIVTLQLEPGPRWRSVALEPGVDLRRRVVDDGAAELDAFTDKLRRNVEGGVIDPDVVRALYGDLDPERPRRSPGILIVQGKRADPVLVDGMRRIAEFHDGARLAWTDSRSHEYGVVSVAGTTIAPVRVVAELRDRILEHVAAGSSIPDGAEVEVR